MIMILQQKLSIIIFIYVFSFVNAADGCENTCGTAKFPYPFGFSSGCPIRLNCADGNETVKIGEFEVQNVTADSIFVNLPAKCQRKITSLRYLFSDHYGMTWQNILLLQNCMAPSNSCIIPMSMVKQRFNFSTCGINSDNITCNFSGNMSETRLMGYDYLEESRCKFLFSSFAFNSGGDLGLSLEFQRVELGWGLPGNCNCSKNAKCHNFTLANGNLVRRCRCDEGFEGDGFKAGTQCRKSFWWTEKLVKPESTRCHSQTNERMTPHSHKGHVHDQIAPKGRLELRGWAGGIINCGS